MTTALETPEKRLSSLSAAKKRWEISSTELQGHLAKARDLSAQISTPLQLLRQQVDRQTDLGRDLAASLATLRIKENQSGFTLPPLPIDHLDPGVRPTLIRALEQVRCLAAQDPATWGLPEEDPPLLAEAFRQTNRLLGVLMHSLAAMPPESDRQLHWAEGAVAVLDLVEPRSAFLTSRGQCLAQEAAWRADWLKWVKRALQDDHRSPCGMIDEVEALVRHLTSASSLANRSAEVANDWWQPRLDEGDPAVWVAADGWNLACLAREIGRLEGVKPDSLFQEVLACLVHDLGMGLIPTDLWLCENRLEREDLRSLEIHCRMGEELLARLLPGQLAVRQAVRWHHERVGGGGYPDGFCGPELSPLAKWISVLEVYGGLQLDRPHRSAVSPVAAWRTLQSWARQGLLDAAQVNRLDNLGPLPSGSLLRFGDGSLAMVAGSVSSGNSASAWISRFTGFGGQCLPFPAVPKVIDPREVGSVGDFSAYTHRERREVLAHVCPWLG